MELLGLFITINGKDAALASFDSLICKYSNKHAVNDHRICKEY